MQTKKALLIREWVVVFGVLGCITSLFWAVPHIDESISQDNSCKLKKEIVITVQGCVAHPGIYPIPPGCTIKEVIDKAHLLPHADKNQLYLKKVLLDSSEIVVFEKKKQAKKQRFR